MKMNLLILSCLVCLADIAIAADGPQLKARVQTQLESNTSKSTVGDADTEKAEVTKVVVKYANVGIRGKEGAWNYRMRFRLNKVDDGSSRLSKANNNVDYAYIGYKVMPTLKLTLGKVVANTGALEGYNGGFQQNFFWSETANNLPVEYQSGFQSDFSFGNSSVAVQLLNGQSESSEQKAGEMGLTIFAETNLMDGKFNPVIAYGNFPRHAATVGEGATEETDDEVATGHLAIGLKSKVASWTIEVESATVDTPKYSSWTADDAGAVTETENEASKFESQIFRVTGDMDSFTPWLKVSLNTHTNGDAGYTSTQFTLGTLYSPDEGPGKIHAAYVSDTKDAEDAADVKTNTKSSKLIVGFGVEL
jgi:hypothetical protein